MNDRLIALFTDTTVFGISILNVFVALCVALLTFLVARAAISFLLRRVRHWSEHDGALSQVLAKVLSGTSNFLLFLASLLVGLSMLDLPERWLTRVSSLWFVVAALQIGLWANRAIGLGLSRYFARHNATGLNQGSALATLSAWGARVLLWSVVLLAMLSNLGVNITAFVASLGVGGHRGSLGRAKHPRRSVRLAVDCGGQALRGRGLHRHRAAGWHRRARWSQDHAHP
ncbi:small-conductance mechanosensitive channel [Pseudomonas sp. BP8]|nr:small-conductance mechanosensitive channel [Pseudomonas sp. BP8]